MNPWNSNFLLLVMFIYKSRVGAREARQWVCPRFISVVCGCDRLQVYSQIQNSAPRSSPKTPILFCRLRAYSRSFQVCMPCGAWRVVLDSIHLLNLFLIPSIQGVLQAAKRLALRLEDSGVIVDAKASYPDYELVLVGHSLGASVAAMLACILRPSFPTLRCYSYSGPGDYWPRFGSANDRWV